jgi:hypothetical protein
MPEVQFDFVLLYDELEKGARTISNYWSLTCSQSTGWRHKRLPIQGAPALARPEAYMEVGEALHSDAERRRWTFYGAIIIYFVIN